jgi:hypothetical protein
MCCPNLSVLNRWFFPPPAPAALDSPCCFGLAGRTDAACGRVKVWEVALGMVKESGTEGEAGGSYVEQIRWVEG